MSDPPAFQRWAFAIANLRPSEAVRLATYPWRYYVTARSRKRLADGSENVIVRGLVYFNAEMTRAQVEAIVPRAQWAIVRASDLFTCLDVLLSSPDVHESGRRPQRMGFYARPDYLAYLRFAEAGLFEEIPDEVFHGNVMVLYSAHVEFCRQFGYDVNPEVAHYMRFMSRPRRE